jgi:hypothetical protein
MTYVTVKYGSYVVDAYSEKRVWMLLFPAGATLSMSYPPRNAKTMYPSASAFDCASAIPAVFRENVLYADVVNPENGNRESMNAVEPTFPKSVVASVVFDAGVPFTTCTLLFAVVPPPADPFAVTYTFRSTAVIVTPAGMLDRSNGKNPRPFIGFVSSQTQQ